MGANRELTIFDYTILHLVARWSNVSVIWTGNYQTYTWRYLLNYDWPATQWNQEAIDSCVRRTFRNLILDAFMDPSLESACMVCCVYSWNEDATVQRRSQLLVIPVRQNFPGAPPDSYASTSVVQENPNGWAESMKALTLPIHWGFPSI